MFLAALWGLAEATLFFIVPDVWLTYLAVRRGLKPALLGCLAALGGALLGGMVMYGWASTDPALVRDVLGWIPAIDQAMIERVGESLRERGVTAVFLGPLGGIPYKIYATEAAVAGIGLLTFIAVSIPARAIRFALTSVLAWGLSTALSNYATVRTRLMILSAFWIVLYLAYFTLMGI